MGSPKPCPIVPPATQTSVAIFTQCPRHRHALKSDIALALNEHLTSALTEPGTCDGGYYEVSSFKGRYFKFALVGGAGSPLLPADALLLRISVCVCVCSVH
jgi:hypothetical protein